MQIDGVLHEFSSIKGVREDVTDIVLNVKSLSIKVMSKEEKKWIVRAWDMTGSIPNAPAFREMSNATDRVLYVLAATDESLTPTELCYLMIARWFRNIDPATARAKMAQLVNKGYARHTGIGRTSSTEMGLEHLQNMLR